MLSKYYQNIESKNGNEIIISIPKKYALIDKASSSISKEEKNALFQFLLNEFFKKVSSTNLFPKDEIAELSYLCEGYFDYKSYELNQNLESIEDLFDDNDEN
jgi:hypothetical protein